MHNQRRHILIECQDLNTRLQTPGLVVLDATVGLPAPRFDGDYRTTHGADGWRQEHIPGSRHADLLHDLSDLNASYSFANPPLPQFRQGLRALGVTDHSEIVIYDRADGFWAARLWWMLRSTGIAARVLNGGWQAWRQAGYATEQGEPAFAPPRPGNLTLRQQPGFWCDRQDVAAVLTGEKTGAVICALSEAVYRGKTPTRYARRGHIPDSGNIPARRFLDETGRYLDSSDLTIRAASYGYSQHTPLLLYCGGGISAASLALSLTLAGYRQLTIYDGSLQEWAADPSLTLIADTHHD
ncbi:sulfurtransferase [Affinibrenneria salicis]|uniref:Sulfurtransferase n=1 Tax=Affinibrenneria salicis TaxID=2590031 RepID=A0A5J5FT57_9GAMM|nr:rhodanese-like domain-containing protein [Affinibrenneria salicis]KAA8996122.1 sulfurtransferase [Affinibrenneria salicis]